MYLTWVRKVYAWERIKRQGGFWTQLIKNRNHVFHPWTKCCTSLKFQNLREENTCKFWCEHFIEIMTLSSFTRFSQNSILLVYQSQFSQKRLYFRLHFPFIRLFIAAAVYPGIYRIKIFGIVESENVLSGVRLYVANW